MLYYRGDRFVKGKKFNINEGTYKFVKKTKDNEIVFESINDKSTLKMLESDFKGVETLVEEIKKLKKDTIKEEVESEEQGRVLNHREGYKDIYGEDADFTDLRKIVNALEAICEQADEDGYMACHHFEDAIRALSSVCEDLEEFYENR